MYTHPSVASPSPTPGSTRLRSRLLQVVLLILAFSVPAQLFAQAPGTGTADGTYDFRNISTTTNSGGTGFKIQGDKFVVSNNLINDGNAMYIDNRTQDATETAIIKAEGGSVNKRFSFRDMDVSMYNVTRTLNTFTVKVYDYFGNLLGQHSLAAGQTLTSAQTAISTFNFSTPWPSGGYNNVSSVEITYQFIGQSTQPDDLTFWDWSLANISNTAPPGIFTGTISGTTFCGGATVAVAFTASGTVSGNIYSAQLSNSAGSFASPTTIGTLSGNASSGSISATIPANTASGTGYRIRVVSSSPVITGSDNGTNLTINPKPTASISSFSNISCFGGNNGTATVAASGGTPGYTYSWSPAGGSNATASNLTAGTYIALITDSKGCQATASQQISQPSTAISGSSAVTNVACFGGSTGAINITASGGTPGYTYNWGSGITTEDRSNLTAGSYGVLITDANGCQATLFPISVGQPSAPLSGSTVVTNIACFGGSTGAINLTPSGGTPGYTFLWNDGATTEDRSGLAAGTYSVTITDANNCQSTISNISVGQPASAVSGTTVVTNLTCFGGSTGAINLTPAGGTPGYTFLWNNGTTTEDRTNLAAGTYSVTITDANNCQATISNIAVGQPSAPVSGTTVVTNVACFNGSTGAINLTASGGTPGFTFLWNDGITTEDRTGLTAGTYSVTITDANGCTGIVSNISVGQPTAPVSGTTVVTNVSCFGGSNGAINLTPSGGTPGYTFQWNTGATTEDRTGLVPGTYSVTITDANGCQSTLSNIAVGQPSAPVSGTTVVTNVACFGGNTGSINLTPSGGTGPYTFTWGSGITTEDRTGLAAGTYSVLISDAIGCTGTVSNISVSQPAAPVSGSTVVTNVSCFGAANGAIDLTPAGGTPGYTYSWGNGISTQDRSGLAPGTYNVTITDANGCTATLSNITVSEPGALTVDAVGDQVVCAGTNTAAVTFSGTGTAYEWTNNTTSIGLAASGTGNIGAFAAVNNGDMPVTATITVTPTSGSCSGTPVSFTITVNPAPTATIAYSGSPYCTGSGTVSVTHSGSTGGTYSATPAGLSINSSTGDINTAASAAGTYTVTYTLGASGGCLPFSTTAPVEIQASFAATIDYPGTPYCDSTGTVMPRLTGTTGGTWSASPAGLSINSSTGAVDLDASAPGVYTVTYGIGGGGNSCGSSATTQIAIRPSYLLAGASNQVVCAGEATQATSFGTLTGISTTWTNDNTSIGLPASGTGDIASFTAINNGSSTQVAVISVTPQGGTGCITKVRVFRINVRPMPTVNQVADQTVCAGTLTQPVNFTGMVPGTVYKWTNTNPLIGISEYGTDDIAPFYALNETGAPIQATFTVIPRANYCDGAPMNFSITVLPAAGSIIYAGSPYCLTGAAYVTHHGSPGGTYTATPGGLVLDAATGSVNLAHSTPGTYTVTYTIASATCSSTATATLTILPQATVSAPGNPVFCNGAVTPQLAFTGTGATYTWTNDNPSVGLAATGSGPLPSFTATNTTATPQYAFISVTPVGNGSTNCTGKPERFRITVNPTPTVTAVPTQVYCRGVVTAPLTLTGNLGTEATYNWTSSSTQTGLAARRGSDVVPSFTTMNPTAGTLTSTITVTPVANKCTGAPVSFLYSVGNCVAQSGGTGSGPGATARTAPATASSLERAVAASPNPARDRVTVSLSGAASRESGTYSVQVLDQFGRTLSRPQAFSGSTVSVDLTGLTPGIYLLRITNTRTQQHTQKQIIKL